MTNVWDNWTIAQGKHEYYISEDLKKQMIELFEKEMFDELYSPYSEEAENREARLQCAYDSKFKHNRNGANESP